MGKKLKPVIKYCPKCHTQMEMLGAGTPSCPTCQPSGLYNKILYYCPECFHVEVEEK